MQRHALNSEVLRSPVLLPVTADPTVSLSVQFPVGSCNDPHGKEGLAFLTGQMLADAATRHHEYDEILALLHPLAANYSICVDKEATTLTGRAHRDTLDNYLPLFIDALTNPAFRKQDFDRVRDDAINYLESTLRYSSDEELAKAALYAMIFEGTPYVAPVEGTVAGLKSITLQDIKNFHARHYTRLSAQPGLGGGYDDALVASLQAAVARLPSGPCPEPAKIFPPIIRGREVLVIDKPDADTSISLGFPINVLRGEREFYALWVATSWLGEHRHQASHLFQVIRELRGLNYGDYAYIEAFPDAGEHTMPPVNVPRRHPIFEIWLRTVPNQYAHFTLRAALRELQALVEHGLTDDQFELTRTFLGKYVRHFAGSTEARLGYAMDDRFHGLNDTGHLDRFAQTLDELSCAEVNDAILANLQSANMKIAMVSGAAKDLVAALIADEPSPIEYPSAKPQSILDEDRLIAAYRLGIQPDSIHTIAVARMFAA